MSLAVSARCDTCLPHTEVYTRVTSHGFKKWHAPAAYWNVHECHSPWVQNVTRACFTLIWARVYISKPPRHTWLEVSLQTSRSQMSGKISAILCELKCRKKISHIFWAIISVLAITYGDSVSWSSWFVGATELEVDMLWTRLCVLFVSSTSVDGFSQFITPVPDHSQSIFNERCQSNPSNNVNISSWGRGL